MNSIEFLKIIAGAIDKRKLSLSKMNEGFMEGDKLANISINRNREEVAHLNGLSELISAFVENHSPVS